MPHLRFLKHPVVCSTLTCLSAPLFQAATYVGSFMTKIQAALPDRMSAFAEAASQYRRSSHFGEFTDALLALFPKAQRPLLAEMGPMIRQEHKLYFRQFVANFCDPSTMSADSYDSY